MWSAEQLVHAKGTAELILHSIPWDTVLIRSSERIITRGVLVKQQRVQIR